MGLINIWNRIPILLHYFAYKLSYWFSIFLLYYFSVNVYHNIANVRLIPESIKFLTERMLSCEIKCILTDYGGIPQSQKRIHKYLYRTTSATGIIVSSENLYIWKVGKEELMLRLLYDRISFFQKSNRIFPWDSSFPIDMIIWR